MMIYRLRKTARPAQMAVLALMLLGFTTRANAGVQTGASDAFGEQVALTLTPIAGDFVTIGSGPLPFVSGTAPAPYNQTANLASASVTGILSTGLLSVQASSNVMGGNGTASANSTVNGLSLAILSLLGITATTIADNAMISGGYNNFSPSGSTTISGLSITGLAAFGALITPTANDVVLNLAGITITLNRQVITTTAGMASITVDAIAVDFLNVAADINGTAGLLNGEIDIAESKASLSAVPTSVPEPASLAVFGAGLAFLGLARRKA